MIQTKGSKRKRTKRMKKKNVSAAVGKKSIHLLWLQAQRVGMTYLEFADWVRAEVIKYFDSGSIYKTKRTPA